MANEDDNLNEFRRLPGSKVKEFSLADLLFGDESKLSSTSRRLRMLLVNSKADRKRVLGASGLDPEEEFARVKSVHQNAQLGQKG